MPNARRSPTKRPPEAPVLREIAPRDRSSLRRLLRSRWGSEKVVTRGRIHQADELPGFVAVDRCGAILGAITYYIARRQCEVVTLDSVAGGRGIGTELLWAVKRLAVVAGCRRVWLITTNDNTPALRFYQKRGFTLRALRRNAIAKSRELKPQIPDLGLGGIPIRDEIELEWAIDAASTRDRREAEGFPALMARDRARRRGQP
jgi:GNAT superfamily N-acetyltransferase